MTTKQKIYIAGSGGMLGEAFYRVFKDEYDIKCTDKDVNAEWLSFLDIREFEKYKKDVEEFSPQYLFHLGAYTDLEFCELNIDETYLTNTIAVENAVYIANSLKIPLLYISTAGIFDGQKDLYDDWDQPNPMGHYARSKYMGERYVVEHADKYVICRAGWMMGGGPEKDKKFINKLVKQLVAGNRDLYIVNDKDGTPTFTIDFAKNVKAIFEKEYWGIYNLVCKGRASRREVAEELVDILGLKDQVTFHDVTSDYFKETYFAQRPPCERLVNKKLELRELNIMRDWRVALREYIEIYFADYLKDKF
jgi:dTDP-4-dehydrorhamnose reductase